MGEDHVSQQLICPISHRIMEYPMVSPAGHTYDRDAILAWLGHRHLDPLSMTPLMASSLYPNRALRNEVVAQLERIATKALTGGNRRLAEAARMKLSRVSALTPEQIPSNIDKLDRLVGKCAFWVTWSSLVVWEQVIVFGTSFGALSFLVLDTCYRLRSAAVARKDTHPPFLITLVRLFFPGSEPRHWSWSGHLLAASLRCSVLLPLGSVGLSLSIGSLLSLMHFARRCLEVWSVASERAMNSHWFSNILVTCNSVLGLSSLGLFFHLYLDHRFLLR